MTTHQVVIDSRIWRTRLGPGSMYGSWARAWASRPGIVTVRVVTQGYVVQAGLSETIRTVYTRYVVELNLPDKLAPDDYVVLEEQRYDRPFIDGRITPAHYRAIAGRLPAWAWWAGLLGAGARTVVGVGERDATIRMLLSNKVYVSPPEGGRHIPLAILLEHNRIPPYQTAASAGAVLVVGPEF